VRNSRTTLTANTANAMRRSCRGDRNEVTIITAIAGMRNMMWRLTKWNGSSPKRAATGGLAASDRTTPASIKPKIAPA
jgi:hypothetical protein